MSLSLSLHFCFQIHSLDGSVSPLHLQVFSLDGSVTPLHFQLLTRWLCFSLLPPNILTRWLCLSLHLLFPPLPNTLTRWPHSTSQYLLDGDVSHLHLQIHSLDGSVFTLYPQTNLPFDLQISFISKPAYEMALSSYSIFKHTH